MSHRDRRITELKAEISILWFLDTVAKIMRGVIPLLLLVVAAAPDTSGQKREAIISGRAVDEGGRPIPNALVSLYISPDAGAFELIMPGGHTLPGGEFILDSGSIASSKELRLFIEEPVPKGFWSPFNGPPFGKLSRLPPFRGTAIWLKPNQARVDLGDVRAGILFAKVVIDLTRAWSAEPRPTTQQLRKGNLRVRDGSGNIIYDGGIPEAGLDLTASTLNLALTKGKWSLELSIPNQFETLQSPPRVINVKTLSCLKVALTDKQFQKPCTKAKLKKTTEKNDYASFEFSDSDGSYQHHSHRVSLLQTVTSLAQLSKYSFPAPGPRRIHGKAPRGFEDRTTLDSDCVDVPLSCERGRVAV